MALWIPLFKSRLEPLCWVWMLLHVYTGYLWVLVVSLQSTCMGFSLICHVKIGHKCKRSASCLLAHLPLPSPAHTRCVKHTHTYTYTRSWLVCCALGLLPWAETFIPHGSHSWGWLLWRYLRPAITPSFCLNIYYSPLVLGCSHYLLLLIFVLTLFFVSSLIHGPSPQPATVNSVRLLVMSATNITAAQVRILSTLSHLPATLCTVRTSLDSRSHKLTRTSPPSQAISTCWQLSLNKLIPGNHSLKLHLALFNSPLLWLQRPSNSLVPLVFGLPCSCL